MISIGCGASIPARPWIVIIHQDDHPRGAGPGVGPMLLGPAAEDVEDEGWQGSLSVDPGHMLEELLERWILERCFMSRKVLDAVET
jgi:hypothetical protein